MTETFAYVGIKECGCIRAATIDNPSYKKEVRRDVAEFLKWGTVERVSVERARVQFCGDEHPHTGWGKTYQQTCPHPQACPHRNLEPVAAKE
jgi:hypothetical protein